VLGLNDGAIALIDVRPEGSKNDGGFSRGDRSAR